jgi:hypothetical protein
MSNHFLNSIVDIKSYISTSAKSRCVYLDALIFTKTSFKVGWYIANKYLWNHGWKFEYNNDEILFGMLSFDDFVVKSNELVCVAPIVEATLSRGVEASGEIQKEESQLKDILDEVVNRRNHGCVVTELGDHSSGVHNYADKLVNMGLIVKRSINPISTSKHCRIFNKSTILHSKLFSQYYKADDDGVNVIDSQTCLDQVIEYICQIFDERNVGVLSAREIALHLGISKRDMQSLRYSINSQNKKEPARIILFRAVGNVNKLGGGQYSALMWCVGRIRSESGASADNGGDMDSLRVTDHSFKCTRNVPVFESVASSINSRVSGVTSSDIRYMNSLSIKRAAVVFGVFSKSLHYNIEKFQDGKQLKHKLVSTVGGNDRFLFRKGTNIEPGRGIYEIDKLAADTSVQRASVSTGDTLNTGASDRSSNGALLSDQQVILNNVILDYLEQVWVLRFWSVNFCFKR